MVFNLKRQAAAAARVPNTLLARSARPGTRSSAEGRKPEPQQVHLFVRARLKMSHVHAHTNMQMHAALWRAESQSRSK